MTDREIMLHRFSHNNIKRSTGVLASALGMSRKEYEEACRRAMKEDQNNSSINAYFDSRDEAIIFGAKQLCRENVKSVFLLKHLYDDKCDVEMQIQ